MSSALAEHYADPPRRGWALLALVLVLHGIAVWAWSLHAPPLADATPAPIQVSFVAAPPRPRIEPPPPPPPPPRLKEKPRVIATPTPTPSAIEAPPLPDEPAPPPPPPAEPAAEPAPAAIIPPSFTAAYLDNPAPLYPPASKTLRETGTVTLRVWVSEQGRTERVEVESSCGFKRLDAAAIDAVRRWRFVPAHQGERALAGWVLVPITFALNR